MEAIVIAYESSVVLKKFKKNALKEFNKFYNLKNLNYLGLHQAIENNEVVLKSAAYIGYRWLNKELNQFIHIKPRKLSNNFQIDYMEMLLECLHDPIVSKSLNDTYKIFFKENWIEIEDNTDEIAPFIILQFLQVLNRISKKGVKKGYETTTQNLTSKIKGKILINQTIKQNHLKNRLDKTVCKHQIFTEDCLENQILKTALIQCRRYIGNTTNNNLLNLLKKNLNDFRQINSKKVLDSDFNQIKNSPFFKEYQEALRLAKIIFKRFGFNIDESIKTQKRKSPPFYIDMEELFKKYTEVKLREKYKDDLIVNYKFNKIRSNPDFIIKSKKLLVNTKYKFDLSNTDYSDLEVLQTRDKEIKEILELDMGSEADILFIYPSSNIKKNRFKKFESIKEYTNIFKLDIYIPTIKSID